MFLRKFYVTVFLQLLYIEQEMSEQKELYLPVDLARCSYEDAIKYFTIARYLLNAQNTAGTAQLLDMPRRNLERRWERYKDELEKAYQLVQFVNQGIHFRTNPRKKTGSYKPLTIQELYARFYSINDHPISKSKRLGELKIEQCSLIEFDKSCLLERLKQNGGNLSQTAKSLGMYRRTLQRKLKTHGWVQV